MTKRDQGKGSDRRPRFVSQKVYCDNFERTFGARTALSNDLPTVTCPDCGGSGSIDLPECETGHCFLCWAKCGTCHGSGRVSANPLEEQQT